MPPTTRSRAKAAVNVPPPPPPPELQEAASNALVNDNFAAFKAAVDTPGFDVNKEIPRRTNLLLAAVFGNQLPFVKYLVEKGANPNLKEGSQTLFQQALKENPEEIAEALIESPKLNINDEGSMETTPLAIAVETKKYRMVRKIFEKAPEQVMKKSRWSRSAFNLSLFDLQALEIFLEKPEVLDFSKSDQSSEDPPFFKLLRDGKAPEALLRKIVEADHNVVNQRNARGHSPIATFMTVDKEAAVRFLLSQPQYLNPNSGNPQGGGAPDVAFAIATKNGKQLDDYLKLPNIDFKFRSEDGKVPLHYAVAFNNLTAVQKFLERDPGVINFQDNTGATPLHFAAKNDNLEIAKLLLEKGASKDIRITKDDFEGQLPVDLAKSDEMKALLATTTAPPFVAPMWKGYTKTDADLFNEMFTKPNDWSFCPVCLSQTQRSDGCMYMHHKCPKETRHEELFQKFKDTRVGREGEIEWCTICGRITETHRHFKITKADAPKPEFAAPRPTEVNEFYRDTCISQGGGGFEEKVRRTHRLLNQACELQDQVDKMPVKVARKKLIEEVWNAGDSKDPGVSKMISDKKFEFPCSFPEESKPVVEAEKTYPDIPRPADQKDLTPIKHEAPDNDCVVELGPHDDGRPVQEFRHKQPDGSVVSHAHICGEDLQSTIEAQTMDGKCRIEPDKCTVLLYPEELKGVVTPEFEEKQRRLFNKANAPAGGGGSSGIMIPVDMDTATCQTPPKKAARRRRTRRMKKRKGRRKTVKA